METVQFPDSVLRRASKVTLADLLQAPFTQPWVVSMISNALRDIDNFQVQEDSEELEFILHNVSRKISPEERMELFRYCSANVSAHCRKKIERSS